MTSIIRHTTKYHIGNITQRMISTINQNAWSIDQIRVNVFYKNRSFRRKQQLWFGVGGNAKSNDNTMNMSFYLSFTIPSKSPVSKINMDTIINQGLPQDRNLLALSN